MPTRSGPLLIAALGLLFFAPLVLHPTQVLYSDYSDILAQHIPAKRFLVRELHGTGELPLWCPYRFGGESFVADPQVAMFYPPHWLLFALPESWVGFGLSWLIALHIIAAGLSMYAYARSQDLGQAGALVAGIGYMFAGKWLLHLLGGGHYVTIGLAWLPLVVLCLERAIRRASVVWATAAGAVYGLLALGTQPQWTFYAGLFLALWTLGTALNEAGYLDGVGPRSRKRTAFILLRWAGFGGWTAVLGAALAAVQFLPTLEAAGQSMRSVGVDSSDLLTGGLRSLTFLFGPALTANPPNLAWEDRGGLGVFWVVAAFLAPFLCRGRVRYQAVVWLILLLFAFGGSAAVQGLPGFRLFRQHARMLMIAAFPVAYLAGVSTNALLAGGLTAAVRSEGRRALQRVLIVAAILVGLFALRMLLQHEPLHFHLYWLTLLVNVPIAFTLLGPRAPASVRSWTVLWCCMLLLDAWGIVWPLVEVRPEAEIYPVPDCVAYLAAHKEEHGRVLDRNVINEVDGTKEYTDDTPLGTGAPQAMLHGLEALRGYNPLDNLRYKEFLQFVTDRDQPLHPLDPDSPLTFPIISDFPVRNKALLDLLGVRYLLQQTDRPLEDPAGWRRVDEDIAPVAYNIIQGGIGRKLPPYTVYENDTVYPRAFVVPRTAALPARENVLATLKETDFRKTALLEGYDGPLNTTPGEGEFRAVQVTEYRPNRVVVKVHEGPAGCLVLADPWFPGWTCAVDGQPATAYRANYLFRGVPLTSGAHEVVFAFRPESYFRGRALSLAALVIVLLMAVVALAKARPWQRVGLVK